VTVDDDVIGLASSWWRFVRLSASEQRADRLVAEASADVVGDVDEILSRANDDSIAIIDALLRFPEAEPDKVGAGPFEDLISESGEILGERIAVLARQDPLWREAAGYVGLADAEARRVPDLVPFLRKSPPRE
jgi:hypothetical protein